MNVRKSRVRIVTAIFVCACFVLGITSKVQASAGDAPKAGPLAAENVQRGQKVFESSCGFCHGATAKGSSTGPSLMDSSLVRHDKDGDLIGKVIREGRVDKGMPSFSTLNDEQISDVVAFLHARVLVTDSVETAGPVGGYQLKHLLTGNVAAGEAYFSGPGGCVKCHSATGDLAGVAKKYQPAELEARFLYPQGKSSVATVTLPSGKQVKGDLVHLDAFYVAITDADGKYHSWDISGVKVDVNDPLSGHLSLLGKYTDKDVHDVFAYLETLK